MCAVLAANIEVSRKEEGLKSYLMGTDIVYKGGFVGLGGTTGYAMAMPVAASAAGYRFVGVAAEKVDNSAGSGGELGVKVFTRGLFKMAATSITQAMVGQMMYLVDDQTFDDVPGGVGVPVGILVAYVSTTEGWIDIAPAVAIAGNQKTSLDFVTKTDNYTVLVTDSGTKFAIATDAKVFTLPSTAKGLTYQFWNTGATDGNNIITISPAAADAISGGGLTLGVANKDLINTKSTANKFDMVELVGDGSDGWIITKIAGIWVAEG